MTPAEIEGRNVVAQRLFDALCAQYPEKYVALTLASLELGKKRGIQDTHARRGAAHGGEHSHAAGVSEAVS